MKIIVVGCGKGGYTIAKSLSEEGHDVVIIDKKNDVFDKVTESLDVMSLRGNALSANILLEAGAKQADLIVCVASNDETNILCAITAKRLGVKKSVARVRDPEYAVELMQFRKDFGLDMIINPEQQAAFEISRLLRFPTAQDIITFVSGRVEIIAFPLGADNLLANKVVSQIFAKIKMPVLLVSVEREDGVFIPHGDMTLLEGDLLRVAGRPDDIMDFFRYIGIFSERIRDVMIIGGGKITRYLCDYMHKYNAKIKIIEIDEEQCNELSENLPNALIIQGDGTDEAVLESENLEEMGAVVCLTDRDEENVVTALYAQQCGVGKLIIKVNHINIEIIKKLNLGSVICPKNLTCYQIIQYVRRLNNSAGRSSIRAMYKIVDNEGRGLETLEFEITEFSRALHIPLKDLRLKKDALICCIVRGSNVLIPCGSTEINENDNVIVVVDGESIDEFDDILE
ncbi:potassium transporter peripheral membrane protein [Clostridia bacterium]|nr:potassium transporter peripheral membrane protein [Clostridia bacterium]